MLSFSSREKEAQGLTARQSVLLHQLHPPCHDQETKDSRVCFLLCVAASLAAASEAGTLAEHNRLISPSSAIAVDFLVKAQLAR